MAAKKKEIVAIASGAKQNKIPNCKLVLGFIIYCPVAILGRPAYKRCLR